MRPMWMLVLLLVHGIACAAPGDVRRFPAQGPVQVQLRVQGSTDLEVFGAVIRDYQRLHPGTEVIYEDVIAWDIYERYLHPGHGAPAADMLISASMDLQTKLVNDGHALAHRSAQTEALPAWAQWRHEVFGISYEPVAIVYNTRKLDAARVPRTRRQLLALLRAPDAPLRGKVGTYDVERSGVGYLFATQDGQVGSIAGALLAALGPTGWCWKSAPAACSTASAVASCCWPTTCLAPMRRPASMRGRRWASCSRRTTRWWHCARQ